MLYRSSPSRRLFSSFYRGEPSKSWRFLGFSSLLPFFVHGNNRFHPYSVARGFVYGLPHAFVCVSRGFLRRFRFFEQIHDFRNFSDFSQLIAVRFPISGRLPECFFRPTFPIPGTNATRSRCGSPIRGLQRGCLACRRSCG